MLNLHREKYLVDYARADLKLHKRTIYKKERVKMQLVD